MSFVVDVPFVYTTTVIRPRRRNWEEVALVDTVPVALPEFEPDGLAAQHLDQSFRRANSLLQGRDSGLR